MSTASRQAADTGVPSRVRAQGRGSYLGASWVCAAAVLGLGTSGLWKGALPPSALPVDPTAASVALVGLLTVGSLIGPRGLLGRHWLPFLICFGSFLPGALLHTEFSAYSSEKTRDLFTLALLCTLGASTLLTGSRLQKFLLLVGALGGVTAIWLLTSGVVGTAGRLSVGEANPIGLGRLAGMGFVVAAVHSLDTRGATRWVTAAVALTCAVGAISTGSRGPVLTAAIALMVVAIVRSSGRHRTRLAVATLVLLVAAWQAALRWAPASANARISSGQEGAAQSSDERVRILTNSLRIAAEHPWGVGWGNLAEYLDRGSFIADQGTRQYPHNVFVEVAAEGGVIALLGMLVLVFISLTRIVRGQPGFLRDTVLGLWIHAVGSAMTSSDITGNRMMWLLLGIGLVLPPRSLERRERGSAASAMIANDSTEDDAHSAGLRARPTKPRTRRRMPSMPGAALDRGLGGFRQERNRRTQPAIRASRQPTVRPKTAAARYLQSGI